MTMRCPECRTRRATFVSMLRHVAQTGHKVCDCGHGRHYPHRPGSEGCVRERVCELTGLPMKRWMPYQPIPL